MKIPYLPGLSAALLIAACATSEQPAGEPCQNASDIPEGESLSVDIQKRAREARCLKEAELREKDSA